MDVEEHPEGTMVIGYFKVAISALKQLRGLGQDLTLGWGRLLNLVSASEYAGHRKEEGRGEESCHVGTHIHYDAENLPILLDGG